MSGVISQERSVVFAACHSAIWRLRRSQQDERRYLSGEEGPAMMVSRLSGLCSHTCRDSHQPKSANINRRSKVRTVDMHIHLRIHNVHTCRDAYLPHSNVNRS